MDYCSLVLNLIKDKKYPVLKNFVILDIYFKMIPTDLEPLYSECHNLYNPLDIQNTNPFLLSYMVKNGKNLFVNEIDKLDTKILPVKCISVKLARSLLDKNILQYPSATFEEEIYHFITLLNFNVPKISSFLDIDYVTSTRFLPQRVTLWPNTFSVHVIDSCPATSLERACFGPVDNEVIPARMLRGHLSACTSNSIILSLNNNMKFPSLKYTQYYIEKWKTLIHLAFNPLENPIILS